MDKPSVVPFVPRMGTGPAVAPDKGRKSWFKKRKRSAQASGGVTRESSLLLRWGAAVKEQQWVLLIIAAGFLLGRAAMLEGIAPFAAAFFGVVLYLRRDMAFWAMLSLTAGSFWAIDPMPAVICAEIGVIYLLYRALVLYEKAELSQAPVVVFAATLIVKVFAVLLAESAGWMPYLLTLVEASLAFVLTLLFVHALPVLTRTKRPSEMRHEEWVGVAILLACLLTGLTGWEIYGVALAGVLSRYFVAVSAYVGGAALGTSAGVIAGMILSLSNLGATAEIGLLAFGGLMAGLLREGGKAASVFGLLLGTSVFALFGATAADTMASTWATVAASVMLLFTPRSVTESLSRFVPGTTNYAQHQQEYAQKVRDLTAERVEKFSEVFRQLSRSFRQMTQTGDAPAQNRDFDHFVNEVHERACAGCHRRNLCWDSQFIQTYKLMTDMMTAVEHNPDLMASQLPKSWGRVCVKTPLVLDVMKRQYEIYRHDLHWRQQLQDSRFLVADQLSGVSQVMDDLVKEIRREAKQMEAQERQIRDALDHLGLAIQSIDILSLEEGHIEIEMVHAFRTGYDECRKMIAPILTEILGETVTVSSERTGEPAAHLSTVTFASAKIYEVETGVAGAAKDGDLLSGDSFSMVELGNGKFAVALSDGMGNGVRARAESSAALSMLEQLLQSGIDERLAVKSVNSILLLRSPDEMFATVDLALIDLYTAHATMLKIGSTPSFIKRGREIIPIAANNLPIGILHDIEIDLLRVQLQPGDTLIMMTDGILDAPGHAINKEQWMKRVLQELDEDDPQEIADSLLDTALRQYPGGIKDDMTVIVTRISRHRPEWAAFRWPGLARMERPRTVS
ncbi:stage II sporulation protein E [Cohnella sp. CIP 111063]|uniref:stage II sporulation protein E n=1 Tax=unclassified Cohnella TaxID=2636738 RepID=UPI000B8C6B2F|nr:MULTISPECIES: stage II sporulation protein E [unclassified Cohnella]OXS54661.1 stage II sporulation protein E [Cohnella sp. CIP 111063]